jgi:hypothetical protein
MPEARQLNVAAPVEFRKRADVLVTVHRYA